MRWTNPRVFVLFSELSEDQRVYSQPTSVAQFRRARARDSGSPGIDGANSRSPVPNKKILVQIPLDAGTDFCIFPFFNK